MTGLVIVSVVVALAVIVALAATNPMMRRREDGAIATVKGQLGTVDLIEPRTTAMGTEPEDAGGVRGMVCLGLNDAELMAVTWARGSSWRIPRASILAVDTPADDPTVVPKATVTVTFARPGGGEATAMFRLRDAPDWLTALGYDWGSDGPPEADGPPGADEGDDGEGPPTSGDAPSSDVARPPERRGAAGPGSEDD
jgi:hypothetical protein